MISIQCRWNTDLNVTKYYVIISHETDTIWKRLTENINIIFVPYINGNYTLRIYPVNADGNYGHINLAYTNVNWINQENNKQDKSTITAKYFIGIYIYHINWFSNFYLLYKS